MNIPPNQIIISSKHFHIEAKGNEFSLSLTEKGEKVSVTKDSRVSSLWQEKSSSNMEENPLEIKDTDYQWVKVITEENGTPYLVKTSDLSKLIFGNNSLNDTEQSEALKVWAELEKSLDPSIADKVKFTLSVNENGKNNIDLLFYKNSSDKNPSKISFTTNELTTEKHLKDKIDPIFKKINEISDLGLPKIEFHNHEFHISLPDQRNPLQFPENTDPLEMKEKIVSISEKTKGLENLDPPVGVYFNDDQFLVSLSHEGRRHFLRFPENSDLMAMKAMIKYFPLGCIKKDDQFLISHPEGEIGSEKISLGSLPDTLSEEELFKKIEERKQALPSVVSYLSGTVYLFFDLQIEQDRIIMKPLPDSLTAIEVPTNELKDVKTAINEALTQCKEQIEHTSPQGDIPQELSFPPQEEQKVVIHFFPQGEVYDMEDLSDQPVSSNALVVKRSFDDESNLSNWVVLWRDPATYEKNVFVLSGDKESIEKTLTSLQSRLTTQKDKQRLTGSEIIYSTTLKNLQITGNQVQEEESPPKDLNAYKKLDDLWIKAFGSSNEKMIKIISMIEKRELFLAVPNGEESKEKWYTTIQNLLGHIVPKMEEALNSEQTLEIEKTQIHLQNFEEMLEHCAGSWDNHVGEAYIAYKGGGAHVLSENIPPETLALSIFEEIKLEVAQQMRGNSGQNVHVFNWVIKCLDQKGIFIPNTRAQKHEDAFEDFGKIFYKDSEAVLGKFTELFESKKFTEKFCEAISESQSKTKCIENLKQILKITDNETLLKQGYLKEKVSVKEDGTDLVIDYDLTNKGALPLLASYGMVTIG